MDSRLVLRWLVIWATATAVLRIAGQRLLHPGDWLAALILFVVSFPLMGWIVRRLCRRFQLRQDQRLAGAVSIALPTLLLDPFSCAFFPFVFPNMDPSVAGLFGGWMLWCCAGAMVGAAIRPGR